MNEVNNKKRRGVLLMRGATVDIYIPSYSATVFSFKLSSDVFSEMEIVNVDLATKLLVDYFTVNKIPPTEFVLIMQTPLFRKEFPLAPQEKLEDSINSYLDYIPFDSVLSKRVKTDVGVMVIAANGDLIQSIRKMFSAASSSIECVTALEGLTIFPKGGLSILTQVSADTILKNTSLINQESFSLTPQRSVEGFEVAEEEEKKKEKSTLPLLIPVFVVLLGILGFVYVKSMEPVTPKKVQKSSNTNSSLSGTPTQLKSNPTIKIVTAKSLTDTFGKVKSQLITAGFTSIIEDVTSEQISPRSYATYSSTVSVSTKTKIHTILKNVVPTITEDSTMDGSYDVTIVIGK